MNLTVQVTSIAVLVKKLITLTEWVRVKRGWVEVRGIDGRQKFRQKLDFMEVTAEWKAKDGGNKMKKNTNKISGTRERREK